MIRFRGRLGGRKHRRVGSQNIPEPPARLPARPGRKMLPMTPDRAVPRGPADRALEAQRAVVAARPDDVSERLLLCELLAFTGDRDAVRSELAALRVVPTDVRDYLAEWQALLAADDARHRGRPADVPHRPATARSDPASRAGLPVRRYGGTRLSTFWTRPTKRPRGSRATSTAGRSRAGGTRTTCSGPHWSCSTATGTCWLAIDQVRKLRLDEGEELRDCSTVRRPSG